MNLINTRIGTLLVKQFSSNSNTSDDKIVSAIKEVF